MAASRKLQGEIDRVLKKVHEGVEVFDSIWKKVYDTDNTNQKEKFEADLKKEIKKLQRYRDQIKTWIQSSEIKDKKVSASYEQALVDARKLIEREMERFKICEKETKTKAFSKEGLGQHPKTDPKEKAKSETRDWLNNVVAELETQIDMFEAELEGLSVKKGKTKPPRLTHLQTSVARHKAHIMKLELILRLLDNDELSSEQVNDVKEFLEDYVERNQDDFDEFADVNELYSSLPLDESLEELVTVVTPGLLKGAPLNLKTSFSAAPPATDTTTKLGVSAHEIADASSQDGSSDINAKSPPGKFGTAGSGSVFGGTHAIPIASTILSPRTSGASAGTTVCPGSTSVHGSLETSVTPNSPSAMKLPSPSKEEENVNFSVRQPSSTGDSGIARERGSIGSGMGAIPASPDMAKKIPTAAEDVVASRGMMQPLVSPPSSRRLFPQNENVNEGITTADSVSAGETTTVANRVASPAFSGMQWKPGSSFTQNEGGQIRARAEIAPDQRERFLQRLQQVQQQGQSNLLGMPSFSGGIQKPISSHHQNPLLQQLQLNSPGSFTAPQAGLGLEAKKPSFDTAIAATFQLQPSPIHPIPSPSASASIVPKDSEGSLPKAEEQQMQQSTPDDTSAESTAVSRMDKNTNEDDSRSRSSLGSPARASAPFMEPSADVSPRQPLPSPRASPTLGVIGRKSVPDLGAVGEIPTIGSNTNSNAGIDDQLHNLQMLDAAYRKLPQPKDSERLRTYIPRNPASTPSSYPQVQAPVVNNRAFWERLGLEPYGADTLFFAFYYQQNTYQQYLAARELKKQSWRYHKKYNTWFQRHEEPKITTDEYEQGTYVYFDFHVGDGELQHGWCQRIKTEFKFEYNYLEDEVV